MYRLKELLSEEETETEWRDLEAAYGREKLEKARELAKMLDRPNSRETAGGFLRAFERFGVGAVEKEARDVAKLARDNPFRNVGTVVYRLKNR